MCIYQLAVHSLGNVRACMRAIQYWLKAGTLSARGRYCTSPVMHSKSFIAVADPKQPYLLQASLKKV